MARRAGPLNLDLFDGGPEEEGGAETSPLLPESTPDQPPLEGPSPPGVPGEAPPPAPTVWTVTRLNQAVRALLEEGLPPLWVSGEVANWTRARSGHCYFTLKDEGAQLRCVLWRTEAAHLPMDPEEGMKIRVFGQLTLYEARGEYQMVGRTVEGEEGEGLWKLAFDRLRKRLLEEGLLAPERKRPLPRFPRSVGVVTSLTGAALHDILTVLRRRAPWLRVVVRGTRVQGDGAAEEIARALRILAESGQVEVVVVGRGGGSLEDLWAFNEEAVARAIAASSVPVISAVGHEVDVTIADLVADRRAPTPSAAAEAVAPDGAEILRYLQGTRPRLGRGLRRVVEGPRRSLDTARRGLGGAARRLTSPYRKRVERAREDLRRAGLGMTAPRRRSLLERIGGMERGMWALLAAKRGVLERLGGKMDALSPLSTLRRGYAVPLDARGHLLRGVRDFLPGRMFELRVVDGRVACETKGTRKDGDHVD